MATGKPLNVLQHSDNGDSMERFRQPENIQPFFESVKRRLIRDCPEFMD